MYIQHQSQEENQRCIKLAYLGPGDHPGLI